MCNNKEVVCIAISNNPILYDWQRLCYEKLIQQVIELVQKEAEVIFSDPSNIFVSSENRKNVGRLSEYNGPLDLVICTPSSLELDCAAKGLLVASLDLNVLHMHSPCVAKLSTFEQFNEFLELFKKPKSRIYLANIQKNNWLCVIEK